MNQIRAGGIVLVAVLMLGFAGLVSAQMRPIDVQCGDAVQGEVASGEDHIFRLPLYLGDVLELEMVVTGVDSFGWSVRRSNGQVVASNSVSYPSFVPSGRIEIDVDDQYLIYVGSLYKPGTYELYITCTYVDGTVVSPDNSTPSDPFASGDTAAPFSGFGFPGVAAVDFSNGIEIPLEAGQAQTVPVGRDVALYSYEASAESVATLSIERVSGDISIGVAVIERDTNAIVFLGGLPMSDKLRVELDFAASGIYVVGLFRLDTAERVDTSGAVRLSIET